jgi:hypothetical protein
MNTDLLHQVGLLGLAILTGVGASVFHSVIKKDHWSKAVNNAISLAYCAVIAGVDLALKGQFKLNSLVPTFLAVYGSAQVWYATLFLVTSAENKPAPVVAAPVAPVEAPVAPASTTDLPVSNEV